MHTRWMRVSLAGVLCAAGLFAVIEDIYACRLHRLSGPLSGTRDGYFESPVAEQTVRSGPYDIYFCAFDMGHEVHMIAYATYQGSNALYKDLVRVSVRDPSGNTLTALRDHATSVLDAPIRWEYSQIGTYTVDVGITPLTPTQPRGSASFTMTLNRRSPTPFVLISAAGVIAATMLTVVALKRKRKNGAS